ncbi:MAG: hypothetical protein WCO03_00620 [bacterium]
MNNLELIIKAFAAGQVVGLKEYGTKPEYIRTQISHIFLFPDFVYKIYRRDNDNFNSLFVDLDSEQLREQFCREDFFTNHYFSPQTYLELLRMQVEAAKVSLVPADDSGDELVIVMKRIDDKNNLTALLKRQGLTKEDAKRAGHDLTQAIAEFPHQPETNLNYYEIMINFMDDLKGFAYLAAPNITKEETDCVITFLSGYVEDNKDRFGKMTSKDLVISIDDHSDNLFITDGEVSMIDAFLPNPKWRIVEPLYCIYRPATDVMVWQGEEVKESFLDGYRRFYPGSIVDKTTDKFYLVYFALIRAAYFFMLYQENGNHKEEAEKYWQFIKREVGLSF